MGSDGAWRDIRGLRANPPGLVASNKGRRRVFAASLQQAEELHGASAGCDYSSRPLPLFYALSQGGRAISAAATRGSDWQFRGHGLRLKSSGDDVLLDRLSPEGDGAFQTVCHATDSPTFNLDLTIAQLLATLPEVSDLVAAHSQEPRAVRLEREYENSLGEYNMLVPPHASMGIYCGPEASLPGDQHLEAMERLLHKCRRADGWAVVPNIRSSRGRPCIALTWREESDDGSVVVKTLETVATPVAGFYYLRPTLGQGGGEISLLMTWWSVLLALSSLARYEPARWLRALDVDRSGVGSALELVLDVAQMRVPELLFEALASVDETSVQT